MQAHTPELYVSWVFSADDPAELYSDSSNYTLLYVNGDTEVTLSRDDKVLETLETGEGDIESHHYLGVRDHIVFFDISQLQHAPSSSVLAGRPSPVRFRSVLTVLYRLPAELFNGDFMNNAPETGIDKFSLSSHNTEQIGFSGRKGLSP